MRLRKDGEETRRRILQAAAEVFGKKGYRDSTNAEICRRCNANSALINYHFQDKETLYRLAWEYAASQTIRRYPFDENISQTKSPKEQLYGRISALIRQNADPFCFDMKIWRKELANPTGLLDELRQKMVVPLRREMGRIIRQILGEKASNDQIKLCTMSIISQCRVPIASRIASSLDSSDCFSNQSSVETSSNSLDFDRKSEKNSIESNRNQAFLEVDIETRIEHVFCFSLGGLMALRESFEK
ncbi:MAG: CerR family C-terminal domain-containing protein [Planctomycetia bacterium]|nr:CerR family C-terminal domain-containing protein [Planctomycetia bacterium]